MNNKMTVKNNNIEILMNKINTADAIVIGGGSGLSSAAGYNHYHSKDIIKNKFKEFEKKYGFSSLFDAYYHLYSTNEERWGFFSQYIKFMHEANPGQPYLDLYEILKNKPYFILTTNVDMQFSKVFPEDRICLFQGDFGYFQCSQPCHDEVHKNKDIIYKMDENLMETKVLADLIPRCPKCGRIMMPWVRDYEFLEGSHWKDSVERYQNFLREYLENKENKTVLFLELGVGDMTPSIIQLPFWKMTASYKNTFYVSVNLKKTSAPEHLHGRTMAISDDIANVLSNLRIKVQGK